MNSTVYDVQVRYGAFDTGAGRNLTGIGDAAARAEHHTEGLTKTFKEFAAVAVGGFGLHEAKKHLIGFNEEMQNLRISTAAQLEASDLAPNFQKASEAANSLVEEFQRFSKLTPVTTRDIASFAAGITTAVGQAGGGIRDIQTVAEQGVIAAKVFGAQADYASLEITEMIQRGSTARMRFAKQLLGAVHETQEHFNALSEAQRLAVIEKALTSKAMTESVGAFSKSFTGVVSTLEDNLQLIFGRVGMPLFEAITKEISGWNTWIEHNGKLLDEYVKTASEALMGGFRAMRDGVKMLVDHKDLLLALGGIWMAGRIGGGVAGILGGSGAGGILGFADRLKGDLLGMTFGVKGSLGSFASTLGTATTALSAFYFGLQAIADWIDRSHKQNIENTGQRAGVEAAAGRTMGSYIAGGGDVDLAMLGTASFASSMTSGDAIQMVNFAKEQKALTADLQLSSEALISAFRVLGESEEQATRMTNITADAFKKLRQEDPGKLALLLGAKIYGPSREEWEQSRKRVEKPNVNVTIQRVEVASDDPDRFVFGAIKALEQIVKAPVTADRSIRGGH